MDVAGWLRDLGLECYETAFRENGVSAEVLCHLTADDLKELGVTGVGHRRQLHVAIAKLNEPSHRRYNYRIRPRQQPLQNRSMKMRFRPAASAASSP